MLAVTAEAVDPGGWLPHPEALAVRNAQDLARLARRGAHRVHRLVWPPRRQTALGCSSITRRHLAQNHSQALAVEPEEIRLAIKVLLSRLEQDEFFENEFCHLKRDTLFAVARYLAVGIGHKGDVAEILIHVVDTPESGAAEVANPLQSEG
jgi:hypothetical protein